MTTNVVCIGYTHDKIGHSQSNQVVINLDDTESIRGGLKTLRIILQEFDDLVYDRVCEECEGEGWVWVPKGCDVDRDPCPRCSSNHGAKVG